MRPPVQAQPAARQVRLRRERARAPLPPPAPRRRRAPAIRAAARPVPPPARPPPASARATRRAPPRAAARGRGGRRSASGAWRRSGMRPALSIRRAGARARTKVQHSVVERRNAGRQLRTSGSVNSPAEMRSGSRSAKTATADLAIGGDEVAERGEERHMRQHLWLDAGAERILPDRREAGEGFALLQIAARQSRSGRTRPRSPPRSVSSPGVACAAGTHDGNVKKTLIRSTNGCSGCAPRPTASRPPPDSATWRASPRACRRDRRR